VSDTRPSMQHFHGHCATMILTTAVLTGFALTWGAAFVVFIEAICNAERG
jgi:hypothetical protein